VVSNALSSSVLTSYTLNATGTPSVGGVWTLQVRNEDNGQADSTEVAWSMTFGYDSLFTVYLSNGYTFDATGVNKPAITATPTSPVCTWALNGAAATNPDSCATVTLNPTLTLGGYNYKGSRTATVSCTRTSNNTTFSCANIAATTCRNFNVTAATNTTTGVAAPSPTRNGTTDGQTSESTTMVFASLSNGDRLDITMSEESPAPLATCSNNNASCTGLAWACTP
jgi:hypothetical protein